ncbi:hypothetical protein [Actinacidiphila soli]|uniref:hypothetical protein n=1 Tax=Actinacidiphila soli TaxID=2487275 RepID=UPI000FCB68C9|nr:hypothetical protein [Actinacidiphila soli]
MATWQRTLDRAGITDPRLRDDYTRARRAVAAFERGPYVAVRLLLPDSVVPHVIAATPSGPLPSADGSAPCCCP